jgi:hypothetical protein
MSELKTYIFSIALVLFLAFGATRLLLEELIALVLLFKRLIATIKSKYSLESSEKKGSRSWRLKVRNDRPSAPTKGPKPPQRPKVSAHPMHPRI